MISTCVLLLLTYIRRLITREMPVKIARKTAREPGSPLVSIIIPCFNHGRYVDEAVESVLRQTWQDFEIIIVNDGSTDEETNRILRSYQRPKTRVIHLEKNMGLPAARNAGIREARGEYILCLDADDKIQETYLEKALLVMEANEGIVFVGAWTQVFGMEDRVWYSEQFDPARLIYQNAFNSITVFRRKAWERVGGFSDMMRDGFEDWEFWVRLTRHGFRGFRIGEKLIKYRRIGNDSFAQRAANKKNLLFEKIKANNAQIYAEPAQFVSRLKKEYKDIYFENPFVNLAAKNCLEFAPKPKVIISDRNALQTLNWLAENPTDVPLVWVAKKNMDEPAMDALYTRTPFVYILPNFLPRYAWGEFILQLQSRVKTLAAFLNL